MDKLQDIYYQLNHLWKGQKAVRKVKELSKKKPPVIKKWLSRQAICQVHLLPPKNFNRPHYKVTISNQMHQFDLLYMPSNTLYGNKYMYILPGIDAASRYKVARTMRMKQAKDVAEMIADIYKVDPLTYRKIFQCDNGSEFKGEVTKLLEKHQVKIQRVTAKYQHTRTAFIEALNKILTEQLVKVQGTQELNDPEKVSSTWVKHLYGLVDQLNNTKTQMPGMKPKEAIELKKVHLVESYPREDTLPEDGLYRYLLQLGEEHDNQRKRAMDRIWSKTTYRFRKIVEEPGNWVMYCLLDGPERALVSKELMLIPEDTVYIQLG